MEKILEVKNLKKYYPVQKGIFSKTSDSVKAVDGVSFSVQSGKTLGLVGESGCGKSTLARAVLRLIEPDLGFIFFKNKDITKLSYKEMKNIRRNFQIIFQDPFGSLDPRFTVFAIISEGLINFSANTKKEVIYEKTVKAVEDVGLSKDILNRYPHEFSGGQRQRISIARALVFSPKLLILDEPVSSLDVSIQAQIINLLINLQKEKGLSYVFIAHDLSVVRHICDQVCVMKSGKIVERGETSQIFANPTNSYTQRLLNSIPQINLHSTS
ncbi:MAG: ATP-binding cassette domain-containing protein [Candidatus Omnitrophica bacterium]|nr:ATP-binding cassette domain-containing protein [Candidatus Omnitrophota bacterium]